MEYHPAVRARAGNRMAIEKNLTAARFIESCDNANESRFAATRRPNNGDEFATVDIERKVIEDDMLVPRRPESLA